MRWLNKPEYWFRPVQILRRIQYVTNRGASTKAEAKLPWGSRIHVFRHEDIGRSICTQGLLDLTTTEAIIRLLEPGEVAVDVGANIGYMTTVMARRLGPAGIVISFEPSLRIFELLSANVECWKRETSLASITLRQCAVSSKLGEAVLQYPRSFSENMGTATIEPVECAPDSAFEPITTVTLDESMKFHSRIALLKIDVEGHEYHVLRGASNLLASHQIRDVIFEEHRAYPAASHQILASHGYRIYRLSREFWRPVLLPPDDTRKWFQHPIGVMENYLATVEPARAETKLLSRGWQALTSF